MKLRQDSNTFDEELAQDKAARWLNQNKDWINLNGVAKRLGMSRFVLINVMAGKTELTQRKAINLLQTLESLCDMSKRVEVKKSLPDGMIEANDDEFI